MVPTWRSLPEIATIALDCGWFPQGAVNVSRRGGRRPYRIPNGQNTSKHSKKTHVGPELEGVGRGGEASGGEEEGGDLHGWRYKYNLEKMRNEAKEFLTYATFVGDLRQVEEPNELATERRKSSSWSGVRSDRRKGDELQLEFCGIGRVSRDVSGANNKFRTHAVLPVGLGLACIDCNSPHHLNARSGTA